MASPAQPPPSPPSPPPPRKRKRSRSPSGERELGALFDPQLSPPGQPGGNAAAPLRQANVSIAVADRAISPGNNGSSEGKDGSNIMNAAISKDVSVDVLDAKSLFHGDRAISPGNNGSSDAKDGSNIMNAAISKDVSVDVLGTKSLFPGGQSISYGHKGSLGPKAGSDGNPRFLNSKDQSISPGHKGSLGLNLDSNLKLMFLNSKGNEHTPLRSGGESESSLLYKTTGCQSFTYNELYSATSGFNEKNLMPQFGPSVYQGQLNSVGKVLVRVYDKVQEKLEEYKEGVLRRFSPSRAHKNIIELIGSFTDEKRLILVYGFPFEVCLGDRLKVAAFEKEKGGLGAYTRYQIAVGLAEALNHIVEQEIPLIPKLFTEEHVFVGPKGDPILVDFIGVAQGVGRTFDSTLEIVRHYGILLGKLRAVKCASGAVLPIHDEVWQKLEEECIQANEYKRPSPDDIVCVMTARMKELFSLRSPMHHEFMLKHNLKW